MHEQAYLFVRDDHELDLLNFHNILHKERVLYMTIFLLQWTKTDTTDFHLCATETFFTKNHVH